GRARHALKSPHCATSRRARRCVGPLALDQLITHDLWLIHNFLVINFMPQPPDLLFRTLADPTRRAIFERLCRDGEQTVVALTAPSGISQPAVSKHLAVLKQAGLVR